MPKCSAHDLIASVPWAIEPAAFDQILLIAGRANESPEIVAAQMGRPLDNSATGSIVGSVAVIPIFGPVFPRANLFTEVSGATSLEIAARDLSAAEADPAVQTVLLNFDSPGGSTTYIAEFAAQISAFSKPLIAYVGDLAASGGYWLAAHAPQIVLSPTALVGSIGVVLSYRKPDPNSPTGEIVSSSSPLKRADPTTKAGQAEAQRIVDELAAVFVFQVSRARKVSEAKVLADFGQGGLLVGAAAVAAGMADRIDTLANVLAAANTPKPTRFMMSQATAPAAVEGVAPRPITRAILAAEAPDLLAALLAEGTAAGRVEGATQERERIQAVLAIGIRGHEALVQSLAFDGHTTAAEAAIKIIHAEQGTLATQRQGIAGAPPPVGFAPAPAPEAGTDTGTDTGAHGKPAAALRILANYRKVSGQAVA
jgi:ClpP class serine protease